MDREAGDAVRCPLMHLEGMTLDLDSCIASI